MDLLDINKENDNTYHFSLRAKNGGVILNSVAFKSKEEIQKTFSEFTSLSDTANFERKTNHNGKFLFSLKTKAGIIIGNSQLYNSEAGMENGIKNTKNSLDTISFKKL